LRAVMQQNMDNSMDDVVAHVVTKESSAADNPAETNITEAPTSSNANSGSVVLNVPPTPKKRKRKKRKEKVPPTHADLIKLESKKKSCNPLTKTLSSFKLKRALKRLSTARQEYEISKQSSLELDLIVTRMERMMCAIRTANEQLAIKHKKKTARRNSRRVGTSSGYIDENGHSDDAQPAPSLDMLYPWKSMGTAKLTEVRLMLNCMADEVRKDAYVKESIVFAKELSQQQFQCKLTAMFEGKRNNKLVKMGDAIKTKRMDKKISAFTTAFAAWVKLTPKLLKQLGLLTYEEPRDIDERQRKKMRQSVQYLRSLINKKVEKEVKLLWEFEANLADINPADRKAKVMEMYREARMNTFEKMAYKYNKLNYEALEKPISKTAVVFIYLILLLYLGVTGLFLILFGTRRGPTVTNSWLYSLLFGLFNDLCITCPIKVWFLNGLLPFYARSWIKRINTKDFQKQLVADKLFDDDVMAALRKYRRYILDADFDGVEAKEDVIGLGGIMATWLGEDHWAVEWVEWFMSFTGLFIAAVCGPFLARNKEKQQEKKNVAESGLYCHKRGHLPPQTKEQEASFFESAIHVDEELQKDAGLEGALEDETSAPNASPPGRRSWLGRRLSGGGAGNEDGLAQAAREARKR